MPSIQVPFSPHWIFSHGSFFYELSLSHAVNNVARMIISKKLNFFILFSFIKSNVENITGFIKKCQDGVKIIVFTDG